MLKWLIWWFIETKQCDHVPGNWTFRELGMSKALHCVKCGKCLDLI